MHQSRKLSRFIQNPNLNVAFGTTAANAFAVGASLVNFVFVFTMVMAFAASTIWGAQAQASTLFEGWYEVYQGTKKIGYMVERFEFTNNQFKSTKYLKTNGEGNNVTESLKAFSGVDLAPQKYAYTSKTGDDVKVVDANFKGDQLALEIFDGKKKTKQTKRIKKGTFLSEFLLYMILQQKGGIKVGNDYSYNAIAEEDGTAYTGSALVKDEEPLKGKKAYRILNEFKKQKFFSWISTKGEPLLVRSPELNIEVRIADNMAQATKDMVVKNQDLTLLFGTVPGVTKADATFSGGTAGAGSSKARKAGDKNSDDGASNIGAGAGANAGSGTGTKSGAIKQDQGIEIKGAKPPAPDDGSATPPEPPQSH